MSYERFQHGYDYRPWDNPDAYDRSHDHMILPSARGIVPDQFDNPVAYQQALWFDQVRADMEARRAEVDYHPDFTERLPESVPENDTPLDKKPTAPVTCEDNQTDVIHTYIKDGVQIIEIALKEPTEGQIKAQESSRKSFPYFTR